MHGELTERVTLYTNARVVPGRAYCERVASDPRVAGCPLSVRVHVEARERGRRVVVRAHLAHVLAGARLVLPAPLLVAVHLRVHRLTGLLKARHTKKRGREKRVDD